MHKEAIGSDEMPIRNTTTTKLTRSNAAKCICFISSLSYSVFYHMFSLCICKYVLEGRIVD